MRKYALHLYVIDEDEEKLDILRFGINKECLIKILKILRPNDWEIIWEKIKEG